MVTRQEFVQHVDGLLNGVVNGLVTGRTFATAVTVVARVNRIPKYLSTDLSINYQCGNDMYDTVVLLRNANFVGAPKFTGVNQ